MSIYKSSAVASRLVVVAFLMSAIGSCSDDGDGGSGAARLPVIFDYSPTLSDADALLYLASNPAVDLLAVTLPGTGEADCEPGTRTTRALLQVAGQDDVPVGCGRNEPLVGNRDWPEEWRAAANNFATDLLPTVEAEAVVDAEQLLADTLRTAVEPVTLIAVGPLTNLGVVLADHPELAEKVAHIVIMGGALDVPGNVEDAPTAEWNIYVDPEAARLVIASGIAVTFVALDATNYMSWNERLVARIGALDTDAARTVHAVASTAALDGFYLWDELAAMAAVNPSLVTTESVTITVDDDGALIRDPAGLSVAVAVTADTAQAMDEFVKGLNRGTAAPTGALTAAELDYVVALGGADSQFNIVVGRAFRGVDESDPDLRGTAATLFTGFFTAADGLLAEARSIDPPASLEKQHGEYVEALGAFVASRDAVLAAVAVADGATLDEVFDSVMVESGISDLFERANDACQALVDYSFVHGGPRPCSQGN